jgi:hypothetical protein
MQDKASAPVVERRSEDVELAVLASLLEPGQPAPWSMAELALEVGCELAASKAVVRLHAAGLVHRCGGFVWPTRAASRFCRLLRE